MKYFVKVNEQREIEVHLEEVEGKLFARIGNEKRHLINYAEVDGLGQYAVSVDQRSYAASIDGELGKYTVGLAGEVFQIKLEDERERAAELLTRGPATGGVRTIPALMPGIIAKLMVQEGDTVTADQPLLILEAMKMQNEIRADAPGKVQKIHVKAGQAVGGGDVLITIVGSEN